MTSTSIAEHALVSDCHSAALVTTAGSVDWLCFPRFDSASVFAALLDDDAGHWAIRPAGEFTSTRRYLDRTLALETTFRTATGCWWTRWRWARTTMATHSARTRPTC